MNGDSRHVLWNETFAETNAATGAASCLHAHLDDCDRLAYQSAAGALLASGITKIVAPDLMKPPAGSPDLGWTDDAMLGLAILEIVGAVLYLLPFSAVLGAIIMTAYIGGAIATHVRVGDAFAVQVILGILIWLGLVFRDARLRAVLPIRSVSSQPAGPSGCLSFIGISFLTLIILIGVFAGVANSLPDNFTMSRSITIDAPPSKVYPHVADFNKWKAWNPFEKPDPNMKPEIAMAKKSPIGSTYRWSSEMPNVGGMMRITDYAPNERIKINLEFETPHKSTGNATFTFKKAYDDKTDVTWTMDGQSPFEFKVMRGVPMVMDKLLGSMFEQGLADMKTAVEAEKNKAQNDKAP